MEAAEIPFPKEETTPPVTNKYRVIPLAYLLPKITLNHLEWSEKTKEKKLSGREHRLAEGSISLNENPAQLGINRTLKTRDWHLVILELCRQGACDEIKTNSNNRYQPNSPWKKIKRPF